MSPPSAGFLMWKVWTRGEAPIINDYETVTNRMWCLFPTVLFASQTHFHTPS